MKKIAIIDIGTNSFILLIAEITNGNYNVLNQYFEIPRLGANLMLDGTISEESLTSGVISLKKFRKIIENEKVDIVLPIATAVLREAKNNNEVKKVLDNIIGTEIKVISGTQEAEFSFLGAINTNDDCFVIDVGGGSTEIIFGENKQIKFSQSFPIGAAKLKSKFSNHIGKIDKIEKSVNYLKEIFNLNCKIPQKFRLIGVGGTITTLAYILNNLSKYDPNSINGTLLSYEQNKLLFEKLREIDAIELSKKYNIHPKRADILTSGQLIYLVLQEYFKFADVEVSTLGLRFGILKKYIIENS